MMVMMVMVLMKMMVMMLMMVMIMVMMIMMIIEAIMILMMLIMMMMMTIVMTMMITLPKFETSQITRGIPEIGDIPKPQNISNKGSKESPSRSNTLRRSCLGSEHFEKLIFASARIKKIKIPGVQKPSNIYRKSNQKSISTLKAKN